MLKDAALLQLELNRRALRADLALKERVRLLNVQWRGTWPVFIDVGSFERLRPAEPWAGYRQFCMLFLYPLMLQAYKDLPFHAVLHGSTGSRRTTPGRRSPASASARGCSPTCSCMRGSSRATPASRGARSSGRCDRRASSKELLAANFGKLDKLVRRLEWKAGETAWTGYGEDNTYDDDAAAAKAAFVREAAARRRSRA